MMFCEVGFAKQNNRWGVLFIGIALLIHLAQGPWDPGEAIV